MGDGKRKYTHTGPEGTVETIVKGDGSLLSIKGEGIYDEERERIILSDRISNALTTTANSARTEYVTRATSSEKNYAVGASPTTESTPGGLLLSATNGRGIKQTFNYASAAKFPAGYSFNDGTPGVSLGGHDRFGRPSLVSDASGERTLSYSKGGGIASENYTNGLLQGYSIVRTFDDFQRLRSLTVNGPDGRLSQSMFYYNGTTGLLESMEYETADSARANVSVSYDPLYGTVRTIQRGRLTDTRTYDKWGRFVERASNGGEGLSFSIRYDEKRKRHEVTRHNRGVWNYGYDSKAQLDTARWSDAQGGAGVFYDYDYNGIGQRQKKVVQVGSETLEYAYQRNNVGGKLNQLNGRTNPGQGLLFGRVSSKADLYLGDSDTPFLKRDEDTEKAYSRTFGYPFSLTGFDRSKAQMLRVKLRGEIPQGGFDGEKAAIAECEASVFLPKQQEALRLRRRRESSQ